MGSDYVVLQPIHLGSGMEGELRKRALERLAKDAGHTWGNAPSIGRWLCAVADEKIKEDKMAYYAILSDNLNEPDSLESIYFLMEPGRTNLSGEQRVDGWLGTTDDIYQVALGLFDADGARALLSERNVQIPDDVSVRHNRSYALGGSERAEAINKQHAYPYIGPWYDVPDHEVRWCIAPKRIAEVRIAEDTYDSDMLIVVATAQGEPDLTRKRTWHIIERITGHPRDEIEEWAKTLIGSVFDPPQLEYWH